MKQDDRGVSLVEILIATAILVICVVPLFKSMILTVQTNAKSRVLLAATSAGEAVLEDLKADGMEAFIQDKDSKQILYSLIDCSYCLFRQTSFRLVVRVYFCRFSSSYNIC